MSRPGSSRAFLIVLFITSLVVLSFTNYLLYHSIVEIISVAVAITAFTIIFNEPSRSVPGFIALIGYVYFGVAILDLLHTLAYKGMGVFPAATADLPTQLWVAARWLEAGGFLVAALVGRRRVRRGRSIFTVVAITFVLIGSIFWIPVFPKCFAEGAGLTPFKVASEYLISATLLISWFVLRQRKLVHGSVFVYFSVAIAMTIVGELFFTLYTDVYGVTNLLGHLFKAFSIYFIYLALVETALQRPLDVLFRGLVENAVELTQSVADKENLLREMNHRIKNNLQLITAILSLESQSVSDEQAIRVLANTRERILGISEVHEQLYQYPDSSRIPLVRYLHDLLENSISALRKQPIRLTVEGTDFPCSQSVAMRLGFIAVEFITNSIRHAFLTEDSDPSITVTVTSESTGTLCVEFSDNGTGFNKKSHGSEGFGQDIIASLVNQLHGTMKSKSGNGYQLQICLPDCS